MKLKKRLFGVFAIVFALCILFLFSFNRLMPIIGARVEQYSRSYATEVMSVAIKEVLEEDVSYGDLVEVIYAEDGSVLALSCNTERINALKSEISLRVLSVMSDRDNSVLKIPVGNLSGMYLLSGRGFDLSVRLIPTDSVLTTVESSFTEVGINQSWHRMTLRVELRLGVIVLGRHSYVDVTDSVVIADTVIVGKVPDAYTKIDRTDSDTVGDIVDFGAVIPEK